MGRSGSGEGNLSCACVGRTVSPRYGERVCGNPGIVQMRGRPTKRCGLTERAEVEREESSTSYGWLARVSCPVRARDFFIPEKG